MGYIKLIIVTALVTVAFVLTDIAFTPERRGSAVITALEDTWTLKRGSVCVTKMRTTFGEASITDRGHCSDHGWYVGERAPVTVTIGRLSHQIIVSRHVAPFSDGFEPATGLKEFPRSIGSDESSRPYFYNHP